MSSASTGKRPYFARVPHRWTGLLRALVALPSGVSSVIAFAWLVRPVSERFARCGGRAGRRKREPAERLGRREKRSRPRPSGASPRPRPNRRSPSSRLRSDRFSASFSAVAAATQRLERRVVRVERLRHRREAALRTRPRRGRVRSCARPAAPRPRRADRAAPRVRPAPRPAATTSSAARLPQGFSPPVVASWRKKFAACSASSFAGTDPRDVESGRPRVPPTRPPSLPSRNRVPSPARAHRRDDRALRGFDAANGLVADGRNRPASSAARFVTCA